MSTAVTGGVPTHIMTAAIVYGYAGTPTSVSLSAVKPYLNWVQTDQQHASTLRANGIKVDIYTNFWRNYTSNNPIIGYTDLRPGGAHSGAEARTCSGSVIKDPTYGGGYEADARSGAALGHALVTAGYRIAEYHGNYDAIFTDDTNAMGGIPLPCGYSSSSYITAVNRVHTSMGTKIFFNAFGAVADPTTQVGLLTPSNVLGGMCEICLAGHDRSTNRDYIHTGTRWANIINAEIDTMARHKIFWDYARATNPASSSTTIRKYIYASFILGYNPSYAMLQEVFQTPSGFEIFPETGLVPLSPLTTASSVAGYRKSSGVYMREFGACYYRGVNKGRCAVVVNSGSSGVSVPSSAYAHSLVLSGYGVLDRGSASFSGGRISSLAAGTGAVLFQ